MRNGLLAFGSALVLGASAHAQTAGEGEDCAPYAFWAAPVAANSAPAAYDVPVARLAVGRPAAAALHPVETVDFLQPPERSPDPGVWAGLLGFTAPVAGTYRISLSAGAWVDVVDGDTLVPSVAFGHGPACEGVAKVVEFALIPGDYAIQISGSPDPAVTVMASRVR